MNASARDAGVARNLIRGVSLLLVTLASGTIIGSAGAADSSGQLASLVEESTKLMPEEYRSSVKKVVVLPGAAPATDAVTGSYEKETLGLLDGMDTGRGYGTINKDIGGIPINFPIRILTVPGAIIGGLFGASTREIQDFRDALTEKLVEAADTTLSNDALATDVFWRLHAMPNVDAKVFALTTPIPPDTDALLYISFSDSTIDVQEDEAILSMSASAIFRRISDGVSLYENQVHYQDRDTLTNWTENDSAAWKDFANFARHYLGREIAAAIYERVPVQSEMQPQKSMTVSLVKKNAWQGVSKARSPTLVWKQDLAADESQAGWAKSISTAQIAYELEIYDRHQLVYSAKEIQESQFTLDVELEACKNYRWSVRPSYRLDGEVRYGKWMRSNADAANGNNGKAAAEAAAYIADFASLEIKCGRR